MNSPSKENITEKNNGHRSYKKKERKKKLPVNIILDDSLVKDVKEWELLDKNTKVVTKHFSGANDMKSYMQPTISNNPEYILLHCDTTFLHCDTALGLQLYLKRDFDTGVFL